jgi:hypothetical protein
MLLTPVFYLTVRRLVQRRRASKPLLPLQGESS